MSFFRIIIPTYNGEKWLPRMISTIRSQTCQDYHLIIVDDMSTDNTWKVIESLKPNMAIKMDHKGYAGGARNEGMKHFKNDKYTLWLDDDDILIDDCGLEKIKENAKANHYPDIIRINYIKTALSTGLRGNHHERYNDPITPADICKDIIRGMPWTKCVKTEKCVEFQEDLLIDDCFQHIMQLDVCETASVIHDDLYEWLVRDGSLTTNHASTMWMSGWYLEIAKLMRQSYIHEWAREAAEMRIAWIKKHMLRGG